MKQSGHEKRRREPAPSMSTGPEHGARRQSGRMRFFRVQGIGRLSEGHVECFGDGHIAAMRATGCAFNPPRGSRASHGGWLCVRCRSARHPHVRNQATASVTDVFRQAAGRHPVDRSMTQVPGDAHSKMTASGTFALRAVRPLPAQKASDGYAPNCGRSDCRRTIPKAVTASGDSWVAGTGGSQTGSFESRRRNSCRSVWTAPCWQSLQLTLRISPR